MNTKTINTRKLSRLLTQRYYIEPGGFSGWTFRKEGSDNIIKRDKHKLLLITFASSYCSTHNTELAICDGNGMLQEIKKFK
jgi:hypothetical protein